jgi:hypothetical protein
LFCDQNNISHAEIDAFISSMQTIEYRNNKCLKKMRKSLKSPQLRVPIHSPALSANEWDIRAEARTALPSHHDKIVTSTEDKEQPRIPQITTDQIRESP